MSLEGAYELQLIDTNCNDCKHMKRDIQKRKSYDYLHEGQINASHRVNYGRCAKLSKDVSFVPNRCVPENENCFEHRIESWEVHPRNK